MKENLLLDYSKFRIYNCDNLLEEWEEYIEYGIEKIGEFLESILNKFNFIDIEFEPYFLGAYLPKYILTVPDSVGYEEKSRLWDEIYDLLLDYSTEQGILPAFGKINFLLWN